MSNLDDAPPTQAKSARTKRTHLERNSPDPEINDIFYSSVNVIPIGGAPVAPSPLFPEAIVPPVVKKPKVSCSERFKTAAAAAGEISDYELRRAQGKFLFDELIRSPQNIIHRFSENGTTSIEVPRMGDLYRELVLIAEYARDFERLTIEDRDNDHQTIIAKQNFLAQVNEAKKTLNKEIRSCLKWSPASAKGRSRVSLVHRYASRKLMEAVLGIPHGSAGKFQVPTKVLEEALCPDGGDDMPLQSKTDTYTLVITTPKVTCEWKKEDNQESGVLSIKGSYGTIESRALFDWDTIKPKKATKETNRPKNVVKAEANANNTSDQDALMEASFETALKNWKTHRETEMEDVGLAGVDNSFGLGAAGDSTRSHTGDYRGRSPLSTDPFYMAILDRLEKLENEKEVDREPKTGIKPEEVEKTVDNIPILAEESEGNLADTEETEKEQPGDLTPKSKAE